MDTKTHWERVYSTKRSDEVSWYQANPAPSLRLLDSAGIGPKTWIIDVGGGDSRLVDLLLDRGLTCVTVLDVSSAALARARTRLGPRATQVTWIDADVAGDWKVAPVDIWHDRAVFHFLTAAEQRDAYVAHLRRTLKVGGTAIIATFGLDGPTTCSGLPVERYDPPAIAALFGPDFELVESVNDAHQTPTGGVQAFAFGRFVRMWWIVIQRGADRSHISGLGK